MKRGAICFRGGDPLKNFGGLILLKKVP